MTNTAVFCSGTSSSLYDWIIQLMEQLVTITGLEKSLDVFANFTTILSYQTLLKINNDVLTFEEYLLYF